MCLGVTPIETCTCGLFIFPFKKFFNLYSYDFKLTKQWKKLAWLSNLHWYNLKGILWKHGLMNGCTREESGIL